MDTRAIIEALKGRGRVTIQEGHGKRMTWIAAEKWDAGVDSSEGVFLLLDLFQIRSIALPFSEVSLDIVELTNKPFIYHTIANKALIGAPKIEDKVRFSVIKSGPWNKLLFNYGGLVIFQTADTEDEGLYHTSEKFPLLAPKGVGEMFLGSEGEVKILNG